MMPKLPYQNSKTRKSITKFLGINYTENIQEGQLRDSLGMTTENYPTLSQRKDREKVPTYVDVTDIFEWDGKFVVVSGRNLYFDDVLITQVESGKKQFAVVNTHLIIMPDGIDIDMSSLEREGHYTFTHLEAKVTTVDGGTTTDTSSFANGKDITATLEPMLSYGTMPSGHWTADYTLGFSGFSFYVYGTNVTAVRNCWQNGAWNMSSLQALETLVTPWGDYNTSTIETGHILIPTGNRDGFGIAYGQLRNGVVGLPSRDGYNTGGYYAVFESSDIPQEVKDDAEYWIGWAGGILKEYFMRVPVAFYDISGTKLFSAVFSVGDFVTVSTGDDDYNVDSAKVTSFDNATNKITICKYDEEQSTWTKEAFSTTAKSFKNPVTIKKVYPKLDYICERANRLWGVSNEDKTIYVSELGVPKNMNVFSGDDTDPYSVAVGSEGDFTAICSYGGATCCFKEHSLVKVLGDYPSNFYTAEYKITGVQSGSEKSLQIINETLLYKGTQGIYTFGGSSPSLISSVLGRDIYTEAVGGSDGERYYISMNKGNKSYLFTYDLVNGLWMKEDSIKADAFARGSDFYMVSDGEIYKLNQEGTKDFDWMAEFTPFYTMARTSNSYSQTIGKQNNTKIYLLVDMEKGSRITVETKQDKGNWKGLYTKTADKSYSFSVPLKIGRCDVFHIRLRGHGDVKIRQLIREYNIGSTR